MLQKLTNLDLELIEQAKETINRNYDADKFRHTVGAAVRCRSGNVFVGVNVYSLHGACAETIALGAAITAGERDFESIVAVKGVGMTEILATCGNCRQLLADYAPECFVIIDSKGKAQAKDLIPFAYTVPE